MTNEEQLVVARRACGSYGGNHRLAGILHRNKKETSIYVSYLRLIKKDPWDWTEYERLVRAIVSEHPDPFGTGKPLQLGPSPTPAPPPEPSPPDLQPDQREDQEPVHGESEAPPAPDVRPAEGELEGLPGPDLQPAPEPPSWRSLLRDAVAPGDD